MSSETERIVIVRRELKTENKAALSILSSALNYPSNFKSHFKQLAVNIFNHTGPAGKLR